MELKGDSLILDVAGLCCFKTRNDLLVFVRSWKGQDSSCSVLLKYDTCTVGRYFNMHVALSRTQQEGPDRPRKELLTDKRSFAHLLFFGAARKE